VFHVCAWCGSSMGQVPPYEDPQVTHGICSRCAERVQAGQDRSLPDPVPPGHALLVVSRTARPLFWHLRAAFEDLPGVSVVWDRRIHERRRTATPIGSDRRVAARRQPLTSAGALPPAFGLRIVRPGAA